MKIFGNWSINKPTVLNKQQIRCGGAHLDCYLFLQITIRVTIYFTFPLNFFSKLTRPRTIQSAACLFHQLTTVAGLQCDDQELFLVTFAFQLSTCLKWKYAYYILYIHSLCSFYVCVCMPSQLIKHTCYTCVCVKWEPLFTLRCHICLYFCIHGLLHYFKRSMSD